MTLGLFSDVDGMMNFPMAFIEKTVFKELKPMEMIVYGALLTCLNQDRIYEEAGETDSGYFLEITLEKIFEEFSNVMSKKDTLDALNSLIRHRLIAVKQNDEVLHIYINRLDSFVD